MRRVLVAGAVLVAVAVGAVLALRPAGDAAPGPGRRAPALPARALAGTPVTLADLRGRPALINFWAAWCGPCKREAPVLRALAARTRGRARVVGVDWTDDSGKARAFARAHAWDYPLLSDPDGRTGDAWGIAGLPTSYVLDGRGRIIATLRGPQTITGFERALGL